MQAQVTNVIAAWRAKYQTWAYKFDDRELAEIILAVHYRDTFQHGTSGHLAYLVLAKLFDELAKDNEHGST